MTSSSSSSTSISSLYHSYRQCRRKQSSLPPQQQPQQQPPSSSSSSSSRRRRRRILLLFERRPSLTVVVCLLGVSSCMIMMMVWHSIRTTTEYHLPILTTTNYILSYSTTTTTSTDIGIDTDETTTTTMKSMNDRTHLNNNNNDETLPQQSRPNDSNDHVVDSPLPEEIQLILLSERSSSTTVGSSRNNTANSASVQKKNKNKAKKNKSKVTSPKTFTTTTTTTKRMTIEEAIQSYRDRVQQTNTTTAIQCRDWRIQQKLSIVNVTPGIECLKYTYPITNSKQQQRQNQQFLQKLHYPNDAELHYNEIRYHMAPYAQHDRHIIHVGNGYPGPWIENQFITYFEQNLYDTPQHSTTTKKCLHDYFGPYIPIFIPWTDHQVSNKYQYPTNLVSTLRSLLRPNVLYITVNQNARGVKDMKQQLSHIRQILPNLIILSAGGHGHVPIPLLKQDESISNSIVPIVERPIDISYVGSLGNAPNNVRQIMHEALLEAFPGRTTSPSPSPSPSYNYTYYYGSDWRQIMSLSKLSLVPRGFGRTAYHLMETIQMGLIPIYVYLDNDVEWIPYRNIYHGDLSEKSMHNVPIGYSTTFSQVVSLVRQLLNTKQSNEIFQLQEERIVALRQSHYSIEGILQQQIQYFMTPNDTATNTKSDLVCQALPKYVTGIPKYGS